MCIFFCKNFKKKSFLTELWFFLVVLLIQAILLTIGNNFFQLPLAKLRYPLLQIECVPSENCLKNLDYY